MVVFALWACLDALWAFSEAPGAVVVEGIDDGSGSSEAEIDRARDGAGVVDEAKPDAGWALISAPAASAVS